MHELKFELGIGALPMVIVTLAFLALGGAFAYAGIRDLSEPIETFGREIVPAEYVRYAFFAAAIWMGGTGLFLLVQSIRGAGKKRSVTLDANRVVTSGVGLSGSEQAIAFRDIASMRKYKVRSVPVIEIGARDGTKMTFVATAFSKEGAFAAFSQELYARAAQQNPMLDHDESAWDS